MVIRNGMGRSGSGSGLCALIVFLVIWLVRLVLLAIIATTPAFSVSALIRSISKSSRPESTQNSEMQERNQTVGDYFEKNWWKLCLWYILIWIFTGSWRFNHITEGTVLGDFFAGMLWPIYWMTKLAVWLTKPW